MTDTYGVSPLMDAMYRQWWTETLYRHTMAQGWKRWDSGPGCPKECYFCKCDRKAIDQPSERTNTND